jgi:hypothetical protein
MKYEHMVGVVYQRFGVGYDERWPGLYDRMCRVGQTRVYIHRI